MIFDIRHKIKTIVHSKHKDKHYLESFYINQREIWYCYLGANIGYEENGKGEEFRRPVLVLKKVGILYWIVLLTSVPKDNNKFYHVFSHNSVEYYEEAASKVSKSGALLSQVRVIDKTRFIHKVGLLSQEEFIHTTKKLKTLLF